MNEIFRELSLLAGGSHYPTVNPKMQQQFGESIVLKILERIEGEIALAYEAEDIATGATLQALTLQILKDFDMEMPVQDDWDAEAELQKIFDEFDLPSDANKTKKVNP